MLETATSIPAVRAAVAAAKADGRKIGFVPTMGALHEGHLRLIDHCRDRSGFTVVSIFVNPTQFGPSEDFSRYPRTLDDDLRKCREAGADLVFTPTPAEVYPRGASATTFVEVPGLSQVLEGEIRTTHFRGVTTVVMALFNIVRPDLAVFGQKDYQQQLLIRRMVEDLHVGVEIATAPTVREPDGLAMSSRNRYLDPRQRQGAAVLHRALEAARRLVDGGERDADRVRQILRSTIESEVTAGLEYAVVADAETLAELGDIAPGRAAVALLAARFGTTRLIDNARLTE
ncbi:MAG: pantoate--beta-alanine ligase [Paludisphaera borealis]|uniref:pantoate--beta-alanine ligase n=1 Tax=Paludisphaera borealis TaxID=1387353 RepID=UPI00283F00BC|nr:pantoate--beta-alanine ligase [Paludisphaera borealis]MDR3621285.1 pantoate--beta-alanine ligase [Paludisphaera borealis]